jgi:hypothetical protein
MLIAFFVFCNIQTGLEYSTIFQLLGNRTVNTMAYYTSNIGIRCLSGKHAPIRSKMARDNVSE